MKKVFKNIFTIALLLVTASLFAQKEEQKEEKKEKKRYEFFKERNISKTYPASGNTLNIENSFGDVKITTWDKNEIKVDVHIEASSTDKEFAEKTFERIDVKDSQDGKNINFKTKFSNDGEKTSCKNCSNSMSVDFDIHMPATNALNIKNSFGGIEIPDYTGPVSLTSKFGSLKAGKLSKPDEVVVEFGKADLKSLNDIDLTFKYSSINIGNLAGTCKLKLSFCSYSQINLDDGLKSLSVDDSYSSVHLVPAANLSATYNISTSYGSLIDKTSFGIKRTDSPEKYGPDLNKRYEGKSGSGATKIDIKSSFGNIMIGQGTKEDMKEKKKVRT